MLDTNSLKPSFDGYVYKYTIKNVKFQTLYYVYIVGSRLKLNAVTINAKSFTLNFSDTLKSYIYNENKVPFLYMHYLIKRLEYKNVKTTYGFIRGASDLPFKLFQMSESEELMTMPDIIKTIVKL